MLIRLDFESEITIYEQLRRQLIEGMLTGKLKSGEALPSVRQFAADLGINMHTVNKAYTSLKQDDYIIIHRQKGVVVADSPPLIDEEFNSRFKDEIKPQIAEALLRGMSEKELNDIIKEISRELRTQK